VNELPLDIDGAIATITMNRPDRRNAMTMAMWHQLSVHIDTIDADSSIRAVIVRGAGTSAFAAGSDIDELPEVYANPQTAANYDRTMLEAQKRLASCTKPTIAMVYGPCFGGGLGIATACDLRFAANNASFCVPPARLGVVYGVSATKRLMDLVGVGTARDLLFSARVLTAAEAWHLGLVERVSGDDELAVQVTDYAKALTKNSSFSLRETKSIIRRIQNEAADDDETYWQTVRDAVAGDDFAEGFAAFQEKRKPRF